MTKKILFAGIGFVLLLSTAFISTVYDSSNVKAQNLKKESTLDFYAAPDGTGGNCTVDNPCSLKKAKEKVQNVNDGHLKNDIVVYLEGGNYHLDKPLVFGTKDSGKNDHTITWTAKSGEEPTLTGGKAIDDWELDDPNKDIWSAPIKKGLDPRQIYVDGERAIIARGEGCSIGDDCEWDSQGLKGEIADRISDWDNPEDVEAVFRVRWRNYHCGVNNVEGDLVTMEQPCWKNSSSAAEDRMPGGWGSTGLDGDRYDGASYLQNTFELLDKPGEFYVDKGEHQIFYIPREGQDMEKANVIAPSNEELLHIEGEPDEKIHNLKLKGLNFEHTAWQQANTNEGYSGAQAGFTITENDGPSDSGGQHFTYPQAAVTVESADHSTITDSTFKHLGGAGVIVKESQHMKINQNKFNDISGGAVYLGGLKPDPSVDKISSDNEVSDNTIKNIGQEFTDSVGIWAGYEVNADISHNTLEHLPYTAISLGWGWTNEEAIDNVMHDNKLHHNRIIDVMQSKTGMHDGGAFYTQGIQPDSVIADNYIDQVVSPPTQEDGNGIYLDERSSDITVKNNVVTRVGYKWVSNWTDYGKNNLVTKNWSDSEAPDLSGKGSEMVDNKTELKQLPPKAIEVAQSAGADPKGKVEQPTEAIADDIKSLVKQYEKSNDFYSEETSRSLQLHLTAISRYEKTDQDDKVTKHTKNLKSLLKLLDDEKVISWRAYKTLIDTVNQLLEKRN